MSAPYNNQSAINIAPRAAISKLAAGTGASAQGRYTACVPVGPLAEAQKRTLTWSVRGLYSPSPYFVYALRRSSEQVCMVVLERHKKAL